MQRDSQRQVAVTGVGAVCGLGWGVARPLGGAAGRPARHRPLPPLRPLPPPHPPRRRGRAGPAAAAALARSCPGWRRLSIADRFALFAALEALAEPGRLSRPSAPTATEAARRRGLLRQQHGRHVRERALLRRLPARPRRARLSSLIPQQVNAPGDAVARQLGSHRSGDDLLLRLRLRRAGARARRWRRCARARWRWRSPAAPTRSASSPTPASTPCARWTRSPAGRSAPTAPACRSARGRRCWCWSRWSGRWRGAPSRWRCSPAPAPPATPTT